MRLVSFKWKRPNSTKNNGVLALRYITVMLIWLGVSWNISRPYCVVIFRETFTASVLSFGVIFRENWLQLKGFYSFCRVFFLPIYWQTCYYVKVRDEVQNVFVKSFQSRSGLSALFKISARCRRRTRLNGRLCRTTVDCQIRTELQESDWAYMQSRKQHRV